MLIKTRNGWRLYSDVFAMSHFYQAVAQGGKGASFDALREIGAVWQPVLSQPLLLGAMELGVEEKIRDENPSYIDPIYIERIFPGAAKSGVEECERWRKQAFDPRKFSLVAIDCLQRYPVTNFESLQELDECMNSLESKDWWLQLGAFPIQADATRVMLELISELHRNAQKNGMPAEYFDLNVIPPDSNSRFYRIRTKSALSKPDVLKVAAFIETIFPKRDKLIGREKQFLAKKQHTKIRSYC